MLAFMFVVIGAPFETLAQEAELYSQIQATDWGQDGSVTNYQYDANGSMTPKVKTEPGKTTTEIFEYNLANRLSTHTKTVDDGIDVIVTETAYTYNQDGIRVKSQSTTTINEQLTDESTNIYLIDSFNHTGYAQVLEEFNGTDPTPIMSYTIGDDVLSQGTSADVSHLLYDGHGSTRQLADSAGSITAQYSFDAYGHMLGQQAGAQAKQTTSLLYAGEQFDNNLQQYYLRARYYDQNNGRFNRLDPVMGSNYDPQSLHKYAYAHNDPVNNVDPTGELVLIELLVVMAIIVIITLHFLQRAGEIINAAIRELRSVPFGKALWDTFEEYRMTPEGKEWKIVLGPSPLTIRLFKVIVLNPAGYPSGWPYESERTKVRPRGTILAHELGHALQESDFSRNVNYKDDYWEYMPNQPKQWEKLNSDDGGERRRATHEIDAVLNYENPYREPNDQRKTYHFHPLP